MNSKKKQLYILCDLEGASQISPANREAMHHGSDAWRQDGRRYITSDLKAICEVANEYGIDEIIVNDEHDFGRREPNVLVEELPANVQVLPRPHSLVTALRKARRNLVGIIMVGQHAMAGGGGFAPHTIQGRVIAAVTVNGLVLGEMGLELALFDGEKFLAVIGEEAAINEARALCPEVIGCAVKSLEKDWFPTAEETAPHIKEKVREALERSDQAVGLHFFPPYRFTLKTSEEYCFDPDKHFLFRGLAKFSFFRLYKGTMREKEISWETKKFTSGLNALHMMRMFIRKCTE